MQKKATDNNLIPINDKTLSELESEGNFLNLIKELYVKISNIVLIGERLDCVPLRLRIRQGCLFSSALFNIILEVLPNKKKRQDKEIKGL